MEWAIHIGQYEMQSREVFSDSLRIVVVSKYAPAEVRLAIRSSLAKWEVSDVSKEVMTAGGLIATGNYNAWLDSEGSYIVNKHDRRKVRLNLIDNTF